MAPKREEQNRTEQNRTEEGPWLDKRQPNDWLPTQCYISPPVGGGALEAPSHAKDEAGPKN
jgi:hypothetical protein